MTSEISNSVGLLLLTVLSLSQVDVYLIKCYNYDVYSLILREKELHFNICVYNPSKDITFSFNLLLHTYFKVPDVRRCQITGLQGCTFVDKVIIFVKI